MWIISFNTFLYMLSWLPLEGKLWLLEAFFGYRYGSLIFWILYQLSNDRGSFKSITHDPVYDKSPWTCAMDWLVYTPGINALVRRHGAACCRLVSDAVSVTARAGRAIGILAPKKQIPLTIGWEVL